MAAKQEETDFNAAFRLRTKLAREAKKLSQVKVATALSVPLDTYKKWENRPSSAVPREKILAFCIVTDASIETMFSMPTNQEMVVIREERRKAREEQRLKELEQKRKSA